MMYSEFETKTHGKWILTGEHAVLRGKTALVFPLKHVALSLTYLPTGEEVKAQFSGEHHTELQLLFWGVMEQAAEMVSLTLHQLRGHFHLHNSIPIGAGMGASAALCVAVSRWFESQHLLKASVFEFAKKLEDLFHSESSGVDIAGVGADFGLQFIRGIEPTPLNLAWKPYFTLTSTDQVGMTNHCVKKVKQLIESHPDLAERIDTLMQHSSELAISALQNDTPDSLEKLAQAINSAKICFTQWGLCGGQIEDCIDKLLQLGAIAAKPTGSGQGGYVLSLWPSAPPNHSEIPLIIL